METDRASSLVGDTWASICSCPNGTDGQQVKPDLLLILFVIILLERRIKKLNKHHDQETYLIGMLKIF